MSLVLTISCQSAVQTPPTPTVVAVPVAQSTYSCTDVDDNWNNDWLTVIAALTQLHQQEQTCGDEPLLSKLYAAHFNFAVALENSGEGETAVAHYTAAFQLDGNRMEAISALIRLEALPEPTSTPCTSDLPPLIDPALPQMPDANLFVQTQDAQLLWQGQLYKVKGINYYPRQAPWRRFIPEVDLEEMATEVALIQQAGFNTLRIFLWYEPLFSCRPEDAIPNEAAFAKVDELLRVASEHDLKVIVTLNDLPDLLFRPLYKDWERYDAQTTYIVRRYRHDPTILAWDLRNEGDLDYGARLGDQARFEEQVVLNWLSHTSELVRANDPNHLLTAGWWGNPTVTSDFVDILSFHHWHDPAELPDRIALYSNGKQPILLEEIGYHSWQEAPQDQRDEEAQAALLSQAVTVANDKNVAGWLIWTAFDFVPEPGRAANYEHYFGLWRSDLTPKPVLSRLFVDEE